MSLKHNTSKRSVSPPQPPPPLSPLKRSSTQPVMNVPLHAETFDTTSRDTASGTQKPSVAPKPSQSRIMRKISGTLTRKRRKSTPENNDPHQAHDISNVTFAHDSIKEETGDASKMPQTAVENVGGSKTSDGQVGFQQDTFALEMGKVSEDTITSTESNDSHAATPKQDKADKKKGGVSPNIKTQAHNNHQLREAPLWKLIGIDRSSSRRHSTGGATHEISISQPILQFSSNPLLESASKGGSNPHISESSTPTPSRSLPQATADARSSLPNIANATSVVLSSPLSATVSQGSLSSSTDFSSAQHKERKSSQTSQASLSSSTKDQKFTPPRDDDTQATYSPDPEMKPDCLSIGKLISVYSKSFPLRVKVLQGYCSESSQVNISTNEVYKIHFVKHTKIVKIKDEDGDTFSIPLGSKMKFGLIYSPYRDLDKALEGFDFEKVSDLLAMPVLPKLVCVTRGYQSNDDKLTLEENEILVIRQVQKSVFKGKRGLKVYSLNTQSDKLLPDDCSAHFATKPSLVRLHLPEIVGYLQNPFPNHAVMYPSLDSAGPMHGNISRVVTITESITETSLVASFSSEEEETDKNERDGPGDNEEEKEEQHFDIPLDSDITEIEVKVLDYREDDEDEHVYDDTVVLANQLGKDAPEGPDYENLSRQPPPERELPPTPNDDNDDEDPYDTVLQFRRDPSYNDSSYDRVGYDRVSPDPTITSWMEDLQSATIALEQKLISMEKTQRSVDLNTMQLMLEQLNKKMESVDSQLQQIHSQPQPLPVEEMMSMTVAKESGVKESMRNTVENRCYLDSMDEEQVLKLLDAMDLSQYKEKFAQEHITGEILGELDEDTLKTELGITSKIHRLRLIKVISGQHSAKILVRE